MPQVGNKKFPYTPSGIRRAQQAMKRKQNPIAATVERFQSRRQLGGALDQLRTERNLRERAENLSPVNQVRQDKMYRPSDGPKVLPTDAPNQRVSQGSLRRQRTDRLAQIQQRVAQKPTKKVFGPAPINQARPQPPNQRLGSPNRRPPIFKSR